MEDIKKIEEIFFNQIKQLTLKNFDMYHKKRLLLKQIEF